MTDSDRTTPPRIHRPQPRGFHGPPSWALRVFALPFSIVGALVMLLGSGRLPVKIDLKPSVPAWIVVWIGALFLSAGLYLSFVAWKKKRRLARAGRVGDTELHLVDHAWDPNGTFDETAPAIRKRFAVTAALAVFLVPFHGLLLLGRAHGASDLWLPYLVIGLFDLVIVLLMVDVTVRVVRWLRHGRKRLRFAAFPYRTGQTLSAVFEGGRAFAPPAAPEVTLRCVRERMVAKRHSGSPRIVYDLLHEQKQSPETTRTGECPVVFTLPADVPGNRLCADEPVYWELVVHGKLRGPDYEGTFLLPVYDRN